ncbi:GNAT family N-acetyltransferase [Agrobacterium fabrum]|uniref:Acetyltransferase (GNAT) family protein n=1 Tax=Agrobacterium fabrum TaxID=1176649 RepID=A0A7Z7BFS8_9HYPH|nr:GNAT family N-acetyltransferase [Agrobacterium fabrum]WCK75544.1 GNAT family N-acetyltransferase [Agrobacterium fabrum]WIE26639.1 GNAT family N-acetyltransferase [Agrobacterium fabrum]WIE42595.1 GNAT family N-acetyltransferase [Agrobacterium fabrum]CUX10001.1 Acetyltransferase [Agrobacterium fabrum str. J-07]SDJ13368.1 Acetyltransferase (GNAT) family protein [Agrobacterium fabrum]
MSSDTISLRAAGPGDLPGLLELYQVLNPSDPKLTTQEAGAVFAAMLAQPGLTIFVATENGKPVATATLLIVPNLTRAARPYAFIENVVTLEARRGRGYGRTVVRHAIERAFGANCYKVMLLTGRHDPAVHAFYESCGFVQNKTGFQIRQD